MTNESLGVSITSWNAEYDRLTITVVTQPLGCSKRFVRMNHSNNHWGQGYKWSWWVPNHANQKDQLEVDKNGRDVLDNLVRQHPVLAKLADEYHIT